MINSLIDQLINLLSDWLTDWMIACLTVRLDLVYKFKGNKFFQLFSLLLLKTKNEAYAKVKQKI